MNKSTFIANDIRNKILNTQELLPNQALKTEIELCKEYGVSKMTLKKALDVLVAEGLINKQRGVGTFIKNLSEKPMDFIKASNKDMNLTGFSHTHAGENVNTNILEYTIIPASSFIAEQLNITQEDFVYHIRRLRSIKKKPIVIEETYMPLDIIPGLKKSHAETSIYSYIEETLQFTIQSSHITICSQKCDQETGSYLNLEVGEPITVVTQTAFLNNGQIFEYSICRHRYDAFDFHTVIIKKS